MKRYLVNLSALTLAALTLSCGEENDAGWNTQELAYGNYQLSQETIERGQKVYGTYCVGCHGEKGDGNGPAARFLSPKPRDFSKCRIKFAGVSANELPTDRDFLDILDHGLSGTAMPSFALLAPKDKFAVVQYIKTFCSAYASGRSSQPVAIAADPWTRSPEDGIAEGEKVYHALAQCWACHPAYVEPNKIAAHAQAMELPPAEIRPAVYDSLAKESDWGAPIKPPDFIRDRIKTGTTRDKLVRVIATGVGGTAMPSWGPSLSPKQLWGLAYYVEDLARLRGTPQATSLRATLLAQPITKPTPPVESSQEQK